MTADLNRLINAAIALAGFDDRVCNGATLWDAEGPDALETEFLEPGEFEEDQRLLNDAERTIMSKTPISPLSELDALDQRIKGLERERDSFLVELQGGCSHPEEQVGRASSGDGRPPMFIRLCCRLTENVWAPAVLKSQWPRSMPLNDVYRMRRGLTLGQGDSDDIASHRKTLQKVQQSWFQQNWPPEADTSRKK